MITYREKALAVKLYAALKMETPDQWAKKSVKILSSIDEFTNTQTFDKNKTINELYLMARLAKNLDEASFVNKVLGIQDVRVHLTEKEMRVLNRGCDWMTYFPVFDSWFNRFFPYA